jgi:hypothetical protein
VIVTVNGCAGPRAYVGLVSTYVEKVTEDYRRLDDGAWSAEVMTVLDVPWMKSLVIR